MDGWGLLFARQATLAWDLSKMKNQQDNIKLTSSIRDDAELRSAIDIHCELSSAQQYIARGIVFTAIEVKYFGPSQLPRLTTLFNTYAIDATTLILHDSMGFTGLLDWLIERKQRVPEPRRVTTLEIHNPNSRLQDSSVLELECIQRTRIVANVKVFQMLEN
jgi:hypothetical protein